MIYHDGLCLDRPEVFFGVQCNAFEDAEVKLLVGELLN